MSVFRIFAIVVDALTCPLIILLLILCLILVYLIIRPSFRWRRAVQKELPKLDRQDFTLEQLNQYDGRGPDKRILIAVNRKVFDVTKNGLEYSKDGPYSSFAGRDASRALACFTADESSIRNTYDDLSDLSVEQLDRLKEWERQFIDRYDYVGRLLRPGEPHRVYESDEDLQAFSVLHRTSIKT
ncbi:Membrane-associated progesterone receptor component [Fasciola hepatica]|uniref:Membrane-associated progesterone receptor component n=1 Tax=Fasciola hepatica TaxID=6192 RepID=A0A4E0R632_FASHE|nr:Membrane-associated progesterone receptor component [Fasciola hepatica]